jgi:RNA polymerase sigma-70 factor (ECF subfamily)
VNPELVADCSLRAGPTGAAPAVAATPDEVGRLYDEHFDFVWRTLGRLGVSLDQREDAVHDVFLVVHRRLGTYEGRSSLKTWLFGIAHRVAKVHRRLGARRRSDVAHDDETLASSARNPQEQAAEVEAAALVERLLQKLSEERRVVLILADLEQVPAPEIAGALGIPLNTVYSRLRLARRDFENCVRRAQARDEWRQR